MKVFPSTKVIGRRTGSMVGARAAIRREIFTKECGLTTFDTAKETCDGSTETRCTAECGRWAYRCNITHLCQLKFELIVHHGLYSVEPVSTYGF